MLENRHFKVVVAGDNAEELMLKYDSNLKVAPYVAFYFSKAEEYRDNYIKSLKGVISHEEKNPNFSAESEERLNYLREELEYVENESAVDYYLNLTEGLELDKDTGDALSTDNPLGMFTSHNVGGGFSLPFILKDGSEVYKAKKSDIDWDKVHLANTRAYEVAWDTTHGLAEPQDDDERNIYEHMKNMDEYFANFDGREHYIASNTAFWGYAFLSEKLGWKELDPSEKQFDWVTGFYDRFIKPLSEDTMLTIYECVRPK